MRVYSDFCPSIMTQDLTTYPLLPVFLIIFGTAWVNVKIERLSSMNVFESVTSESWSLRSTPGPPPPPGQHCDTVCVSSLSLDLSILLKYCSFKYYKIFRKILKQKVSYVRYWYMHAGQQDLACFRLHYLNEIS